jgi:hypothetical protein
MHNILPRAQPLLLQLQSSAAMLQAMTSLHKTALMEARGVDATERFPGRITSDILVQSRFSDFTVTGGII